MSAAQRFHDLTPLYDWMDSQVTDPHACNCPAPTVTETATGYLVTHAIGCPALTASDITDPGPYVEPGTTYALLIGGDAHVIAEGPTDHYGRQNDPAGSVGYAYRTACGLGDETFLLLPGHGEHTADRPIPTEWGLCSSCFPEGQ